MRDDDVKKIILKKLYELRNIDNEAYDYIPTLEVIDYPKIGLTEKNLYRIMKDLKDNGFIEGSIMGTYFFACNTGEPETAVTSTCIGQVKITNLGIKQIENDFFEFLKNHGYQILGLIITIVLGILTIVIGFKK